jgi:hypothetical protein
MNPAMNLMGTSLRVCRACHSSFRVRRRLGSGLFCLLLAVGAIAFGVAALPHPLGLLALALGAVVGLVGFHALRPSTTCSVCHSRDTAPMGPDGGPMPDPR